MKVVQTARGLFPREQLQVAILQHATADGLALTAEWRVLADGPNSPFVKRDAHTVVYASPGDQAQARALGLGLVVETSRGLLPRDDLQVSVVLDEGDNHLVVATEWRVKAEGIDAPHVRRDVLALMLATPETQMLAQMGHLPMPQKEPTASNDVTIGLVGQQIGVEQAQIA